MRYREYSVATGQVVAIEPFVGLFVLHFNAFVHSVDSKIKGRVEPDLSGGFIYATNSWHLYIHI